MGFLDKIKSAKNFVTGGGADIELEVGHGEVGGSLPVTMRVRVGGAALDVQRVYVVIRGLETVRMTVRDHDDPGDRDRIHETAETFRQEVDIYSATQLEANSEHSWPFELTLPEDAQPSYYGQHATHEWQLQAALDVRGNDPDSGWVAVHIR
jgi:hypothetical protein